MSRSRYETRTDAATQRGSRDRHREPRRGVAIQGTKEGLDDAAQDKFADAWIRVTVEGKPEIYQKVTKLNGIRIAYEIVPFAD